MQSQSIFSPSSYKLFGYSFLILFFELALIRFISSNVRITAYFINLVLVAAFLGMGIGMIRVKREKNLTQLFLPLLLLLTGACVYFSNILVVAPRSGEAIYAIYYDLSPHSREGGMVPVVSVIFSAGRKNIKNSDWTLFLLGASFLLLETKSVTEMSLLFGST